MSRMSWKEALRGFRDNAVSPFALGTIERLIGPLEKLVNALLRSLKGRYAYGRCDIQGA